MRKVVRGWLGRRLRSKLNDGLTRGMSNHMIVTVLSTVQRQRQKYNIELQKTPFYFV